MMGSLEQLDYGVQGGYNMRQIGKVSRGYKRYGLVLFCFENNKYYEFSISDKIISVGLNVKIQIDVIGFFKNIYVVLLVFYC